MVLPSTIDEYKRYDLEQRMQNAFQKKAEYILNNEDKFKKDYLKTIVGLENEFGIVDKNYKQVDEAARNALIDFLPFADVEVGAAQIEIRTDKMEVRDLTSLFGKMFANEYAVLVRAKSADLLLVRGGTNPFVPIKEVLRTDKPKYQIIPSFHDHFRNGSVTREYGVIDKVDLRSAAIMGLCNSTQCNIESRNFTDAIAKANYTYMISSYLIAVSTNARFVEMKDTGIEDIRTDLWVNSHDIRTDKELSDKKLTRIGEISSYFTDMKNYFNRVKSHPFILDDEDHAFEVGMGLYWKDVRIKFMKGDSIVIEYRPISMQPTLKEDIAMHGFYLGRLAYAQAYYEPLMDISRVNTNRRNALDKGLDAELFASRKDTVPQPAREVVLRELTKAREGLSILNIKENRFLDILERRTKSSNNPSKLFAEGFYGARLGGADITSALVNGFFEARGGEYESFENSDCYA